MRALSVESVETKDQQVKHVVQGVAIATLAHGVAALTSEKMALEFASNRAWREWPEAANFPSIRGHDPGNLFWIGIGRSLRRVGAIAAWDQQQRTIPYLVIDTWSVEDCLAHHADERGSVTAWRELGRLFVADFKPDQIQHTP